MPSGVVNDGTVIKVTVLTPRNVSNNYLQEIKVLVLLQYVSMIKLVNY